MSKNLSIGIVAAGLLAFAAGTGRAEDNTTVVIDGVVSNNAGAALTVGNAGANNLLSVINGGSLTNCALVTVGTGAAANNNRVSASNGRLYSSGLTLGVSGAQNGSVTLTNSSLWDLNGGTLTWGSAGSAGNTLAIDSTSCITNVGVLGFYESGRTAIVGPSHLPIRFSDAKLNVGKSGNNAPISLTISNALIGTVAGCRIKSVIGDTCNNASLQLIDSEWPKIDINDGWTDLAYGIVVGNGGATNNVLTIDNTVVGSTVNGNGGLNEFDVGNSAGSINNRVTLCNGARVYLMNQNGYGNGACLCIGNAAGANYNRLVVSTNGLLASNPGNPRLEWTQARIGNAAGATGNALIVDGGTYSFANASPGIYVGYNGSSSMLIVTNGGKVYCGASSIGQNAGCNNNGATVTGSGSLWDLGAKVLGIPGVLAATNNMLNILDQGVVRLATLNLQGVMGAVNISGGGALYSTVACTVGNQAGADSNAVTVAGANSLWNVGNQAVTVGTNGNSGNTLTVGSGGMVTNVSTFTVYPSNAVNMAGGTLYATTLDLQTKAVIYLNPSAPGRIDVAGNATLDGIVTVTNTVGVAGPYTIMTVAGTIGGPGLSLSVPGSLSGNLFTNTLVSPKQIILRMSTKGLFMSIR